MKQVNSNLFKLISVYSLFFFISCSTSLDKSLQISAPYNWVYYATVDSVMEAGFGIVESDIKKGYIEAEQNSTTSENAKYKILVELEDEGSTVDIDFAVKGPAFTEAEKEKALEIFKRAMKHRLPGVTGNL